LVVALHLQLTNILDGTIRSGARKAQSHSSMVHRIQGNVEQVRLEFQRDE
jgi:hypothetical protein